MGSGIEALGFYLLRVPRLPLEVITELNSNDTPTSLGSYFNRFFGNPEMLDAIFLASEALSTELAGHLDGESTTIPPKILPALYKYVVRMAGRATPYGKFSGIAYGDICDSTVINLTGDADSALRIDMAFSAHLSKLAVRDRELRHALQFHCNDSLYELEDHYRYIEYREKGNKWEHKWVKVMKNPLLCSVLEYARNGRSFGDLVQLVAQMGVPDEMAVAYLDKLVAERLLMSELEPFVTGKGHFSTLVEKVSKLTPQSSLSSSLGKVDVLVKESSYGSNLASGIRNCLENSIGDWTGKELIQADLRMHTSSNRLDKGIVATILREIGQLLPLNVGNYPPQLSSFRQRFLLRYGEMEVPLMEALDQDKGIGYGEKDGQYLDSNPLLAGLGITHRRANRSNGPSLSSHVIKQYWNSGIFLTPEVEIDLDTIKEIMGVPADNQSVLPLSGCILGNLLADDSEALDNGNFRFNLLSCSGPSALPLMARFSHLDGKLERKLRECALMEDESCPDAILAEVIHLPGGRIGNILQRPVFRKYEIPLLGQSSVDKAYQIPLSDLWVSVKDGLVHLRSERLGKTIIPRLSCAHNYRLGLMAYQFLCDLQHQSNGMDIVWEWGEMKDLPFLPRVTYKHIILSRAQWNIPKTFLADVGNADFDIIVDGMRKRFRLPEQVVLADADNELMLSLDNPMARKVMVDRLKKGNIKLYESLFSNGKSPVKDNEGKSYFNQILLPFKTNEKIIVPKAKQTFLPTITRRFPPGSEWTYLKLYCGERDTDWLLYSHITTLVDELEAMGVIEKWFFIRYHDPDPHIRIRFLKHSSNGHTYPLLVDCIGRHINPLLTNGLVQRLIYDTYERELERYGHLTMELCESIFHIDSRDMLRLLPMFSGESGERLRWLSAAVGIDDLLSAFGNGTASKLQLVDSWRAAFHLEFGVDKKMRHGLDTRYRENRELLERYLWGFERLDPSLTGHSVRRAELEKVSLRIQEIFGDMQMSGYQECMNHLMPSLCHMYLNRIFFSNQRENEMVIYHFLSKFYLSESKRKSKGSLDATDTPVNHRFQAV